MRWPRATPESPRTPGLTVAKVWQDLHNDAQERQVFIKDFPHYIKHLWDDAFLGNFHHSFLIRDPEKVLTSMHSRWPDVTLPEIGFEELHTLFRRVADRDGTAPVVIDSDEILASPEAGMKAYCDAVGIPFVAEALTWEKRSENPTWNSDDHGFHDSLKASTGFKTQKRDYPPLESSKDMMRLYRASRPHYEALFEIRIRIGDELSHERSSSSGG